jgi:ATP-binding protein involved in chromosome partitioning
VLKAIEMFQAVRVPVVGVVENMAGYTCPECGHTAHIFLEGAGEKAAKRFDVPLLGKLPLDPLVPPGGDTGKPVVVEHPKGPTADAFRTIARAAVARLDTLETKRPGFDLDWSSGV